VTVENAAEVGIADGDGPRGNYCEVEILAGERRKEKRMDSRKNDQAKQPYAPCRRPREEEAYSLTLGKEKRQERTISAMIRIAVVDRKHERQRHQLAG